MKNAEAFAILSFLEKKLEHIESEVKIKRYCEQNGLDYKAASDYARAAISVLDYIEPCSLGSSAQNSKNDIEVLPNSNISANEVDRDGFLLYNDNEAIGRIVSLYCRVEELERFGFDWKRFTEKAIEAGKKVVGSIKERAKDIASNIKLRELQNDEAAVMDSINKVEKIIDDLKSGAFKRSPWYKVPAMTVSNPFSNTSVVLLNPLAFYRYCKPVRDCMLYHEYQHVIQYDVWRRQNPTALVKQWVDMAVPHEIEAYKATLLCLKTKLLEIRSEKKKHEA